MCVYHCIEYMHSTTPSYVLSVQSNRLDPTSVVLLAGSVFYKGNRHTVKMGSVCWHVVGLLYLLFRGDTLAEVEKPREGSLHLRTA